MRPARRLIAAALLAAASPLPSLASAPSDIGVMAADTIRRLDLQRELPRTPEPILWHIPGGYVAIALGCAAILLLLWLVFNGEGNILADWRIGRRRSWATAAAAAEAAASATPGEAAAADALAGEGRFAEAMHLLLLQSLTAIRERREEHFADSLTSREILRQSRLSDQGAALLRDIVARVEWTYFGQHPAGRPDYEGCRTSFHELSAMLRDRATA
jgi:hypothetical protein